MDPMYGVGSFQTGLLILQERDLAYSFFACYFSWIMIVTGSFSNLAALR